LEPLEDRRLLALGSLLQTLADPNSSQIPARAEFGYAVAADGDRVAVGAPAEDSANADHVGAAYVFNSATGQTVASLANPTPAGNDCFGISVAISGNLVVVGAPYDDTGATNAGAAYVFDATTGSLVCTLANPVPAASDNFGWSVAISGNIAMVGAYLDDMGAVDTGGAYVFDATTGVLLQTLANPSPADGDNFGLVVAISGTTVVVGAPMDDTTGASSGSAYVFDASSGSLVRAVDNPTPAAVDWFGCSVAVWGNRIAIGAQGNNEGATNAGEAYVFDVATGGLVYTLANPAPAENDYFGVSVAISGDLAVVGGDGSDVGAMDSGKASVFDLTTGALVQTIVNPTPAEGDRFGLGVAIAGSRIVVGAACDDTGRPEGGAVYLFDASTGGLQLTLVDPTRPTYDDFGQAVDVDGNTVLVGARYDDASARNAGTAYLIDASTGQVLHTLANPTPAAGDAFGYNVAISGNLAVVGTPADGLGAAYVFDTTTGNLLWTLSDPTSAKNYFGSAVAISGNNIVVGAYYDHRDAGACGVAYVFDASTGQLRWTLRNPTPADGDWFGMSVAVSGNTVVVGAFYDDAGGSNAGAAHVFDASTGTWLYTLTNPAQAAEDRFGSDVAVSGSTIVVGATRNDTGASNAGAAYVFDASTGNLRWTLNNPTPVSGDSFGASVAVSGDLVVVGAYNDNTGYSDAGAAYLFDASAGNLLYTLQNPTPAADDHFGWSVAISGNVTAIGTPGDDGVIVDGGAAYLFSSNATSRGLDVDGNGAADALTDGILMLRFLFSSEGQWSYTDALGTGATRTTRESLKGFLDARRPSTLDVDGNGTADALTDGILILRYLFAPTGEWTFSDAVGTGATRSTRAEIKAFLDQYFPGEGASGAAALVAAPETSTPASGAADCEAPVASFAENVEQPSWSLGVVDEGSPVQAAAVSTFPDESGARTSVASSPALLPPGEKGVMADCTHPSVPAAVDATLRAWDGPLLVPTRCATDIAAPEAERPGDEALRQLLGKGGLSWFLASSGEHSDDLEWAEIAARR
jgi:outer membrane protein assembly factor BamB